MNVEAIQSLCAYNRWANERLLLLAEGLAPERTRERSGASFDTIHATLAHILAGEIIWLSRWQGMSPGTLLGGDDFADLRAVRLRWEIQRQAADAFLAELTEGQLAAPISYVNTSGEPFAYPLWQMVVHVVNHGTHHRSELADMLTRVGSAPPPLDLLVYIDELNAARFVAKAREEATGSSGRDPPALESSP